MDFYQFPNSPNHDKIILIYPYIMVLQGGAHKALRRRYIFLYPYIGVGGFPYGIFDPWTLWGWGLDGLGKFVRRRRRRRRRRRPPARPPSVRAIVASNYKTCIRL